MTSKAVPSTSFPTEANIRSSKRRLTSGHFSSETIDIIDLDELKELETSILKRKLALSIQILTIIFFYCLDKFRL
jgi:hypothetical protein